MRSAFALFRPVVSGDEFERLRREFRSFAEVLGKARNLDVLLAAKHGEEQEKGESGQLDNELRRARKQAYSEVTALLAGPRIPILMLDLVGWAEAGAWRKRRRAGRSVPEFAAERLDRAWRRVRKRGGIIAVLSPEDRHRLRIEVKKLRYAAEFFASLACEQSRAEKRQFLDRLEAMQESLGTLNDLETAKQLDPDHAFAADDRDRANGLIAEAQAAYRQLKETGRYWR